MRIQQAISNFTANGQVGPWLFHDVFEPPFDLSLLVDFGTGLAATIGIDYVMGAMNPDGAHQVFITQATTTITVTDNGPPIPAAFGGGLGHCLAVGDTVVLTSTPGGSVDGIYAVATVTSATVYTLTSVVSQTIAGALVTASLGYTLQGSATDKIITLAPVTARTSVAVTAPILASRLHVTAFTTGGTAALIAMQGGTAS
jgi:hypothetical protein